ncbi:MAG: ATP-binding protein, partial [Coriobacteriales bacterium]|nr:ATP-binding protein [Coriobacteriales bacterium]
VQGDAADRGLFHGLAIEESPHFAKAHSRPVVWLNFREIRVEKPGDSLGKLIKAQIPYYLSEEQIDPLLSEYLDDAGVYAGDALKAFTVNLHRAYGAAPFVLIDEYDKLVMDAVGTPRFNEVRDFTKSVLSAVLKDNDSLGKGLLTGVNRISQESIFSDLNNLKVCDVFRRSVYDTDFGFTEAEVAGLCTPEELAVARKWYNGYRIGDEKVYFTYSVMSYLESGTPNNYWGRSGTMNIIKGGLTYERIETVTSLIGSAGEMKLRANVKDRLAPEDMAAFPSDDAFYSLLVQTGYLTYDRTDEQSEYDIYLPNTELRKVWEDFILSSLLMEQAPHIKDALALLSSDTLERFNAAFTDLIDSRLSYIDLPHGKIEDLHHVFIAGILAAIGTRFHSNREAGLGRYDICAYLPDKTVIFEFKEAAGSADTPADKRPALLATAAQEALKQIHDRDYAAEAPKDLPVYAVGIGFLGKTAAVRAEAL